MSHAHKLVTDGNHALMQRQSHILRAYSAGGLPAGRKVSARHILCDSEEETDNVAVQLESGADFAGEAPCNLL